MQNTKKTDQRVGFTLIELLVVISIIALLIGILLPALSNARSTARSIVCASSQKGIGVAMFAYSLDNEDVYTGPNTSGASFRRFRGAGEFFGMQGDTSSTTPTTVWDWMSPMLGDSMNFSPNRAKRTSQIFNDLSCPEASLSIDSLFGSWLDSDDFERVLEEGESFRQISYLTPAAFH
ncbi:MAG: prepilin-type N-terminal cleavage/methylation domain-containing protein, partial [Phycisphaerales bacterium]|nr:prepilin-type N-terminal cleavage/methylation domain-containing protein [Phycisphaerales bacterium]